MLSVSDNFYPGFMRKGLLTLLLSIQPVFLFGQGHIESFIHTEYSKGHFNGTVLVIKNGEEYKKINKGYANFQFRVPVDDHTRFSIASTTKLFTAIIILQLYEDNKLSFEDQISNHIPDLPNETKRITISDLLLHSSGLKNEPIQAYTSKYTVDDYLKNFLSPENPPDSMEFNYNNVDYVLLTKLIQTITEQSFQDVVHARILEPLNMKNTGFVQESKIIPDLAYGYHNYTFGSGTPEDELYNDSRYLSNYYGAGAIYSTAEDLSLLLSALKTNQLISEAAKNKYLIKEQKNIFVDWLQGKPTFGFFIDENKLLRRTGNIDGANSVIVTDTNFNNIVIILTNTDTGDLKMISNEIFELMK